VTVEQAVAAALASAGAERWISTVVSETGKDSYRQARRGRPGANTTYVKTTSIRYSLAYMVRNDTVAHDAASDGCFPLITTDTAMTAAEQSHSQPAPALRPRPLADLTRGLRDRLWLPLVNSRISLPRRAESRLLRGVGKLQRCPSPPPTG
jgi:hypothetical protein